MSHPLLASAFFLALTLPSLASTNSETNAWASLAQGLYPDNPAALKTSPAPSARLAYAASLLVKQPATRANVDEAEQLLSQLAQTPEDPRTTLIAAYLHARIPHIHRTPADLDTASARYQHLWQTRPDDLLGQESLVKQATIELYRRENPAALFATYAATCERFSSPIARRDMHLALADAAQRHHQPDTVALTHLRAALAAAPSRPPLRADLLIRIAELARRTGDLQTAANHYALFIDEFPRDNRRTLALERSQSLQSVADSAPDTSLDPVILTPTLSR